MTDLIFISAQPSDFKFTWQIDVQCWNFRELGISKQYQVLIYVSNENDLKEWNRLIKKYPEVQFFFYYDKGVDLKTYIPQLRPHILKQHFEKYDLKDKTFFYLDSDVIFRELPDFKTLLKDDICWQSNTSSYLDYNYLIAKEKQGNIPNNLAVKKMAEIGRITPEIIQSYTGKTGGAQYLLKNIDADFWGDVERICIDIRKNFTHVSLLERNEDSFNTVYFQNEDSGFQSWCADMWAVNFSLWKRNKITDIHKELDFTWATDNVDKWFENKIYHDAGGTMKGLFNKSVWNTTSPVGKNISVLSSFASYHYVEAIKKVK
jgi:hypothetical protein